jgi:homoserine kinase
MEKKEVKLFSPATVANVSCGFDILGFCLDTIGDDMIIRKTKGHGITITKITGFDLPTTTTENVAGISALALMDYLNPNCGFEIEIHKRIKPGSGIGSSAASAAGSVYGINYLLGNPLNKTELTSFAMKGEAYASKAEHADNLAPALFGGFTLVKSTQPLQILQLPTPSDLFAAIIHPQIEIKTADARAILPRETSLKNCITQTANMGSFVHALHTSDYDLIESSLKDVIIEPHRKALIPKFETLQENVMASGALGCGISGSGPSIYTLCKGQDKAKAIAEVMTQIYSETTIPFEIYVSKINTEGIKILK